MIRSPLCLQFGIDTPINLWYRIAEFQKGQIGMQGIIINLNYWWWNNMKRFVHC
jgi:hypothetical protein